MKQLFLALFVIVFFTSCAGKISTAIDVSKEININKNEDKKVVYIDVQNQTSETINLKTDIKNLLKEKGYAISSKHYDVDFSIFVNVIYANEIEKKSGTKSVLSNINLGVGIGGGLGKYVHIGTRIGSDIGDLFGDSLDSNIYQIVCDITISEYKTNKEDYIEKDMQIIATASLDGNEKRLVLDTLEDEIIKEIVDIF